MICLDPEHVHFARIEPVSAALSAGNVIGFLFSSGRIKNVPFTRMVVGQRR